MRNIRKQERRQRSGDSAWVGVSKRVVHGDNSNKTHRVSSRRIVQYVLLHLLVSPLYYLVTAGIIEKGSPDQLDAMVLMSFVTAIVATAKWILIDGSRQDETGWPA